MFRGVCKRVLKLRTPRKGSLGKELLPPTGLGKADVRDEKGAEQKHELRRNCDPAAPIERVRAGNPSPKVACSLFFYPTAAV